MEALDSRYLHGVPVEEASTVIGQLIARLAVPAPPTVPRLADVGAPKIDMLRRSPHGLPRRMCDRATRLFDELIPGLTTPSLVHGALSLDHVLAGDREPWLAISPKPLAAHPAWDVAPLLLDAVDTHGTGSARWEVRSRLDAASASAGLDVDEARLWCLIRLTLDALTSAGEGRDDRTTRALVAAKSLEE